MNEAWSSFDDGIPVIIEGFLFSPPDRGARERERVREGERGLDCQTFCKAAACLCAAARMPLRVHGCLFLSIQPFTVCSHLFTYGGRLQSYSYALWNRFGAQLKCWQLFCYFHQSTWIAYWWVYESKLITKHREKWHSMVLSWTC